MRTAELTWQDVLLSFFPAERRTSLLKARLAAWRLPLILAAQAALTWRLSDISNDDEALYIHGGHVVVAYLMHGGAGNAAQLRLDGTYFSGAPDAYPLVAAVLDSAGGLGLVRFFSLCCMLVATLCVYSIGRHLFDRYTGLLAALTFGLAGSVQFMGKLATYDAPCLGLVALAAMLAVTKRSMASAAGVGALLAAASATKYAGLALVPFVLLLTFFAVSAADGKPVRRNLLDAVLRGGIATLVFAVLVLGGYHLWGAGIATGVRFTTTGRKALDPTAMAALIRSLLYDIGLTYALAIGGILLTLRRRAWHKALLIAVMLGAGSVIQASSLRIHEFTSLDKHTAFTALFCAVPAAVALSWALSKRGRITVAALAVIWLLLIDGMWRSHQQYSWPASLLTPINEVKSLGIPGLYVSFDADDGTYYTPAGTGIDWYPAADAYTIFGQGVAQVTKMEKSHKFTGFLFDNTNLSTQNAVGLEVFDRLIAADPYYFETSTFRVGPYTKAVWQLWIHYPARYHGPSLKKARKGL